MADEIRTAIDVGAGVLELAGGEKHIRL